MRWLGIALFAMLTSVFEVITATVIVVFAQVLNQPDLGGKYLQKVGISQIFSPSRTLFYIAIVVGFIYLVKNTIAAFEVFYQNFSIQKMNYSFKQKLLSRYADVDYSFYLTRNSSLGVQVISGDAEAMFSVGMIAIATILSEGVIFLCLIGMIVMMNPILALIVFGIGAVLGGLMIKFVFPQFYRWGQRMQESSILGQQNLLQFFHGFKEIILLGKREFFVNAYVFHARNKSRVHAIQTACNALPRVIIEVLFVGFFVATVAFLCFEHDSPAQMMGILGGYLYAGFRLMPGLNRIINQLNLLKSSIPSVERVYNEFNVVTEKEHYADTPAFHFEKNITLTDASFRYPHAKKDALCHVTLEIKKGESIGIVGETGSGKSTLVDVILGLLHPYQGTTLVDDKFSVHSYQWHQYIGYVPQSIYLTDDSIAANIAFGERQIDERRMNEVIDAAQLRRFIDALPGGVETIVGERGIRLSGGERQRIAIARALYRDPQVLIFDEATSALDNETEEKLMETINAVSKGRTVIMIAHRLTTLKNCDRMIKVEGGEIIPELPSHKNKKIAKKVVKI